MSKNLPSITVCICTYKRPEMLKGLLLKLQKLETSGFFTYSAVIIDNDREGSAKETVDVISARSSIEMEYFIQPERNIALARNMAVKRARGDYIAFIDDDEYPVCDWLLNLFKTYRKFEADGVLGPVRPHFEAPPPGWVLKGGFCDRPEYKTGTFIDWTKTRTGNVLLGRHLFENIHPFDPQFSAGGEDTNFFRERTNEGYVFIWCNEAVVYEIVPPNRLRKSYFVKRAFLRGNVSIHFLGTNPRFLDKAGLLIKSSSAILLYTVVLPFTLIGGLHIFMKYLLKNIQHASCLLGLLGLVQETNRNI